MTDKKDDQKSDKDLKKSEKEIEKDELEKKLEDIQKEKQDKEGTRVPAKDGAGDDQELQNKIIELEKQLKDQMEIVKRAQYDYMNLKLDWDHAQRIMDEKSKTMEVDILIDTVKKFLPFLETLRKSLITIPEAQKDDPLVKGLQMMYDNFLKTLESMNIKVIESVGLVPDSMLHEAVNVVPVEDKKKKGKIVEEWERGFVYEKDGDKKIVIPAKVIVGN